jgi:hypothetical protein
MPSVGGLQGCEQPLFPVQFAVVAGFSHAVGVEDEALALPRRAPASASSAVIADAGNGSSADRLVVSARRLRASEQLGPVHEHDCLDAVTQALDIVRCCVAPGRRTLRDGVHDADSDATRELGCGPPGTGMLSTRQHGLYGSRSGEGSCRRGFPSCNEVAGPAGRAAPASRGEDMKTSTRKRIARPLGLLLLALLVVALAVPAAQAFPSDRYTLLQLAQAHRDRELQAAAVSSTNNAAQNQLGWAWGYYYSDAGTVNGTQRPTLAQLQKAHDGPYASNGVSGGGTASTAQSTSSGISSTTVWIAAAAVLGAVLIGGWALLRRRSQREAAPACESSAQGC